MITLTSSKTSTLEPIVKSRWVFQFSEVPGDVGGSAAENLAFAAHTATPPQITFNATERQRLNERVWTAGKGTWNDLSCTFYDYIDGTNSAGNILYNWSTGIYDPITGQMGFKSEYTTSATLAHLDPAGAIVRLWNIFYIWPMDVQYGDSLSYDDDAFSEITVSFKYDYAIKAEDVNTSPSA